MPTQKFKKHEIQSIVDDLAALEPTESADEVGKIQAIRQLEPALRAALRKGYSLAQIVQRLNEQHHLETSVHAVRAYLGPRYAERRTPSRQPSRDSATSTTPSGGAGFKPDSDLKRRQREKEQAMGGRFVPPPDIMDI